MMKPLLFAAAGSSAGALILGIAFGVDGPSLPPRWVLCCAAGACFLAGLVPLLKGRWDPAYSILVLAGWAAPFNWAAYQAAEEFVKEALLWRRLDAFGFVLLATQALIVVFTAAITLPLDLFLLSAVKRALRPSPEAPRTP